VIERSAGLVEQARMLAAGEVTSAALVDACLEAVQGTQSTLNAFAVVRAEAARAEAAAADRRLQRGERGPLLGVPIAIKDDTDLAGTPTAFGCGGDVPTATTDAEIVRRIKEAGGVIVGKTTTPELGLWPFTESPRFGVTRSPWSPDHTPGGSSGGSAAAVSAGVIAAATGSDGAGSVRIPASWTNLVGIKPQRGRISTWPDAEAFYGLTCHGVLARTVADAALLLDVTAGNHPGDRHQPIPPREPYHVAAARDPGRLRVGVSTAIPYSLVPTRLDPQIEAGVRHLGDVLAGLGHEVIETDPRYGLVGLSFLPRSHAGLRDWCARLPDPGVLEARTRQACAAGRLAGPTLLGLARRAEGWFARRVGVVFDRVDVLVTPTTAAPPLPLGRCAGMNCWQTDRVIAAACPYAWPWNVLGWPALNVPAGLTTTGLPFGAQLVGPACSEEQLISLAAQLEATERWDLRRPPMLAPGSQRPEGLSA
jgi:amidase